MSWLSKTAKKVEKNISRTATKLGVGNDLKKAANIYGAGYVGGAVGAATGFLTGGAPGAIYGGITGGIVAGYGKYKGDSSSKYLSNAAGDALITSSVGPLLYKPGGTALITAPKTVAGYADASGKISVKTASGGFLGEIFGGAKNFLADAVTTIGKGGLTKIASDSLVSLFKGKIDPSVQPNPDYQQGNAVAPGQSFPQWLSNILPGKSADPNSTGASAGGSSPQISVSGGDGSGGGLGLSRPLIIGGIVLAAILLFKGKKLPRFA